MNFTKIVFRLLSLGIIIVLVQLKILQESVDVPFLQVPHIRVLLQRFYFSFLLTLINIESFFYFMVWPDALIPQVYHQHFWFPYQVVLRCLFSVGDCVFSFSNFLNLFFLFTFLCFYTIALKFVIDSLKVVGVVRQVLVDVLLEKLGVFFEHKFQQ